MRLVFRRKSIGTACMCSERVKLRLADIVENADRIAGYIAECDLAAYSADQKTVDAVERCLTRVTEAVIHIGEEEAEQLRLGAPWRAVKAMGNRLRHEYRRINSADIFATVSDDLPPLRAAAARALES